MLQDAILQQFNNYNPIKLKRKNTVSIDGELIIAILNGYLEDKEILDFLAKYKDIKYSSIRYSMRKLLIKFNVSTRSELYRRLIKLEFAVVKLNQDKIPQQNFL